MADDTAVPGPPPRVVATLIRAPAGTGPAAVAARQPEPV